MDDDHQRDKPSPPELRRSERILRADQIAPRGLTKVNAAAYCGCSEDAFDTWVKKGLVPGAIPALSVGIARRLTGILTELPVCLPGRPHRAIRM